MMGCKNITDEGIKSLRGVHTLYTVGTSVTQRGLAALKM